MEFVKRTIRPEQIRELSLVAIIIVVIIFFGLQIENYFTPRLFNRISSGLAILVVVAVGQTLVVLTRNIDLSVGSMVGFTAYFVGTQLADNNEMEPIMAVFLAVGVGTLLGSVNGVLVAYGRIPAIITTLGTLAIYRTMLVEFADAQTVITSSLPTWIVDLPRQNLFSIGELNIRLMVVLAFIVVVLFHLILTYLPWGRRLYAIGSNPEAANLVGLPVQRTVFSAFMICGALSGLAGFLFLARFGNITVVAGLGLELQVVAAVVVGGVNIFGGAGTIIGALLGAILIATLEQSLLRWEIISEFWRDALLGLLILLAVAVDAVIMERVRNYWARSDIQMISEDEEAPIKPKGGTYAT
jgi:rhamnose transport system permease protein